MAWSCEKGLVLVDVVVTVTGAMVGEGYEGDGIVSTLQRRLVRRKNAMFGDVERERSSAAAVWLFSLENCVVVGLTSHNDARNGWVLVLVAGRGVPGNAP